MNRSERRLGKGVRKRIVDEPFQWGVYGWQMPDGKVLGWEGNMLNVPSIKDDIFKMAAIKKYVNEELGIFEGKPVFFGGIERLTEDEYADQMEQLLDGKVPDRDYRSLRDDLVRRKRQK